MVTVSGLATSPKEMLVFKSTPTTPLLPLGQPWLLPLLQPFATTTSGLPSPFTSATAIEVALYPPEPYCTAGSRVPSPLPRNTPTVPGELPKFDVDIELAASTSGLPSPFTSPSATERVA